MASATGSKFKALGEAPVGFRLGDCTHRFQAKFQITPGDLTPVILGVAFWWLFGFRMLGFV